MVRTNATGVVVCGPADASPRKKTPHAAAPASVSSWERHVAMLIVLVQAFWAIAVPIKNVIVISNPTFRVDSVETETSAYNFPASEDNTPLVIPGKDIVPLLQKVLHIVIGDRGIRSIFEASGSFDLDTVYQLLTPEGFHVASQYYAMVFQATEFPGGIMTPRSGYFDAQSLPDDALGVWVRPTNASESDWLIRLACSAEDAKLQGTRCFQGNTTHVCYDFPKPGEVRRYEDVELQDMRANSGFANNIGQLYLIEVFHSTMAKLFSSKSWKKTLENVQYVVEADEALANAFSSVYHEEDGRPLILETNADEFSLPIATLATRNLDSCVFSELFSSKFYTKAFVLKLIQSTLQQYDMYEPNAVLVVPPSQTDAILKPVLAFDLLITSGARYEPVSDSGSKRIAGVTLATVKTASMRLKLDKKLNGEQVYGSSLRMLDYMACYPEYYSYLQHQVTHLDTSTAGSPSTAYDSIKFSILGSGTSGLNTFKGDWWANTMEVYRLRELSRMTATSPVVDPWWDDERKIASWFQKLESSPDAPFYLFDKYIDVKTRGVVLNDDPKTACHRAFFKTLTKIAFLSLLGSTQLPSYLIFMSNINGGARPWFATTMQKFELYGETIAGIRHAFSYSRDTAPRKDDCSAWVAVPLLFAMLNSFNKSETLRMLAVEFNQSFATLVSTENGLVHFSDRGQCRIGFARNNVSADTNTMAKIMDKFYPSVVSFFADLLDNIPALQDRMTRELAEQENVKMVEIRHEMIVGSPSGPAKVHAMGSPIFWTPTAFTAGMLKFWPGSTPPQITVDAYRNATVCYRTLELRYLNQSVRCWVEPNNIHKSRVEHNANLLRNIVFSNWSISLVLNAIAIFIAAGFIWRLWKAWRITQFRCLNVWVALQLNFQGFGVLSFPQVLLLTMSTIPLLLGFHVPVNNVFITDSAMQHWPKALNDAFVTLSASWFHRMGFEIVNHFVVLHEVSVWLSHFRLRMLSLTLIFILRVATPDKMQNAEYELAKLMLTLTLSVVLGGTCALVPLYQQHRHPARSSVVVPTETKSQNIVVTCLQKHGMPLNKYGLIGFSSRRRGWALTGLLVEGWEVVERKNTHGSGKCQYVVSKGMCRIPLAVEDNGRIKCIL